MRYDQYHTPRRSFISFSSASVWVVLQLFWKVYALVYVRIYASEKQKHKSRKNMHTLESLYHFIYFVSSYFCIILFSHFIFVSFFLILSLYNFIFSFYLYIILYSHLYIILYSHLCILLFSHFIFISFYFLLDLCFCFSEAKA